MKKVFIRLLSTGKIYTFEAKNSENTSLKVEPDQRVLVELGSIVEEGIVTNKPSGETEEGNGAILRIVTLEDRKWLCHLKGLAREFIEEARKKVMRHSLSMKILDADLSFDQKKLTFYFSANGRVDFRGLVLDMAKSFERLIRLQQVGARDEAKYFGGIGKCGRELCCAKFLSSIETITLEMAQDQELATAGASKLSGCCGKLMCCLAYESQNYPSRPRQAEENQKIEKIAIKDKIKVDK